ncbi:MAG: alpha/beta fold hydrolase [Gammaproteobacteria bacterium]|nr:alpha/beta fold hydrolase [Gammaproteobacteria bacterium]
MKEKLKIQSRKVQFKGFDGSLLQGNLDFPLEIKPEQYIIVSHCFTCTRQILTTARLSRGLAHAGMAVLSFDFTGLGNSEGDFADTHFRSMLKDIECAADWLATFYEPASILIGHSMGGTASLAAAQNANASLSHLQKIITLASPAYPSHILHHFGSAMMKLRNGEAAQIMVAGRFYEVKPDFIEDVESYDMDKQMQACNLPIMAVRAGDDELVKPEAAEQILRYTVAEHHLVQIEGADHLFSDRAHAAQLLDTVLNWIG